MPRTFTSLCVAMSVLAAFPAAAFAYQDDVNLPDALVSANPADNTPVVPGGWDDPVTKEYEVNAFLAYNGVMYAGGKFPLVQSANGATSYPRSNMFAFDPNTGAVSPFAPDFNGQVQAITQSGGYLYVSGDFSKVNGVTTSSVVKIDPSTGALVTAFAPAINGKVSDVDLAYGSLVIAGKFTTVGGQPRVGLANVDLVTGAVRSEVKPPISGSLTSPTTGACVTGGYRMAINAQKTKLVLLGCFTKVFGYAREQLVLFNLGTAGMTIANWKSPDTIGDVCHGTANPAFMEDVDFGPPGRYFYVAAGGGNRPGLCDSAFKYDTAATGALVHPNWVKKTGGDTLRAIEATQSYTYVAGHQRWIQQGGVSYDRPGIAALTAGTATLSGWNPGKGREVGSRELYITNSANHPGFPTGLWVGSDSGDCGYLVGEVRSHVGICFFPTP